MRDGMSNETICEMAGVKKIRVVLWRAEVAMVWAHRMDE